LTIGIQSLEKHLLQNMDRAQQSRVKVGEVISEAREYGVKTINIDLMAGLPGQTLEDFQQTFEEVLSWRPEVLHPYPYQNTSETRFYAEGFRTDTQVVQRRSQMMEYAHRRLQEEHYLEVPNESWCLGIEHRNQQDVDKIISSSSVLPLGYVARGHVFGALTYGTVAEEFQAFMEAPSQTEFYYGHRTTPLDEQVRYIISNLRTGFSRVDFEAIFGVDCLDHFWWHFSVLEKLGKVQITSLEVKSLIDNSLDSVLYAKLFFADEYHAWLREHLQDRYDPSVNYTDELERHYERSF
jgi:coproporphyrinogen III oxidase-like Fe-S oxidoreductase